MAIRVQLIQNSPLHKIPSILINVSQNQYLFNVIPSFLRHRKNHQINLIRNTNIFFTKHSIQAFGGLPNLLLYSFKTNQANTFSYFYNTYCDRLTYNYLQKLRFKLGYRILRMSYCTWNGDQYRFGIHNHNFLQKIQKQPDFPSYFAKIQQKLSSSPSLSHLYHNSKCFLKQSLLKAQGLTTQYFKDNLMTVIPLSKSNSGNEDLTCISYLCIPQKIAEKPKPKGILILHYNNEAVLKRLYSNRFLNEYLQENNQIGLIIHIVEDSNLIKSQQFKIFIERFGKEVKHLWYNNQFIELSNQNVENQYHIISNGIWSKSFPSIFIDIHKNKQTYHQNHQQKFVKQALPDSKSFFYRKMFASTMIQDKYQEILGFTSKIGTKDTYLLKLLLEKYQKQIQQLAKRYKNAQFDMTTKPRVTFLGSASAFPTSHRNTMGILLALNRNLNILLDCGQGTFEQMVDHFPKDSIQQQLLNTQLIFITHIHPDHNLGIMNLISQRKKIMKKHRSKKQLFLIMPFNVFNWYIEYNKTVQDLSQCCDVLFTQFIKSKDMQHQILYLEKLFGLDKSSFLSKGNNPLLNQFLKGSKEQTNYFKNNEKFQISMKNMELISNYLFNNYRSSMKWFKKLLKYHQIDTFKPVQVIHCPQAYGIIISSDKFKLSYSGDTKPSEKFKQMAKNSTFMIHQATFDNRQFDLAIKSLHSTISQAITMGKQSNSKYTILTHFGDKIQLDDQNSKQYSKQLLEYMKKNVIFSFDHLQINLENMQSLPQITQLIMKIQCQKQALLKGKEHLQQLI